MNQALPKVLVYGYGNPGRLDDGLGPNFAERLGEMSLPNVTVDSNYQLSVEDAATVAEHDAVVFVDAHVSCETQYFFDELEPMRALSFSSHSVAPEVLLDMAGRLLSKPTDGYVLGIRGYDFNEFGEGLSEKAEANMRAALDFLSGALACGDLRKYANDAPCAPPLDAASGSCER